MRVNQIINSQCPKTKTPINCIDNNEDLVIATRVINNDIKAEQVSCFDPVDSGLEAFSDSGRA